MEDIMWLLLLACAPLPEETADQYGFTTNTDAEGTVRVLEFATALEDPPELSGYSEVYRFWNYPEGTEAILAQTGTYDISYEHVVTTPVPDSGVSYSNMLLGFRDGRWLELEVDKTTGALRRYEAVDEKP